MDVMQYRKLFGGFGLFSLVFEAGFFLWGVDPPA